MGRRLAATRGTSRPRHVQLTLDRELLPRAFARLYAPSARRKLWAFSYPCPVCGGTHLGRARELDGVRGTRKAGCGRKIFLDVSSVDLRVEEPLGA
ncbi:hypothetical protein [Actinomadura nitritigenes]|uniref:hypothetical protein n=1 Tax=Actinomadura nitritigenes TaxID=134602 RepID=UPI003D8BC245